MLPPPVAAIGPTKARQHRETPVRLTSIVSCHWSGSRSATEPKRATAAVLASTFTGPTAAALVAAADTHHDR